jgi:hypothetical protein
MQVTSSLGEKRGFGGWLTAHFGRRGDLWFIVATLVLGWSAVIWTGFLGNPGGNPVFPSSAIVQVFFKYPLPLYGWFLLDYLIVMAVIFFYDYPSQIQRGARSTLLLTVIFSILAGLLYLLLKGDIKGDFLSGISDFLKTYPVLIAAAINVLLVVGYWLLVAGSYFQKPDTFAPGAESSLLEGLIGDLMAAILLSFTLAVAFFLFGIAGVRSFLRWTDIGCEWSQLVGQGPGCVSHQDTNLLSTFLSINLLVIPLIYLACVFALICIIAGIQLVTQGTLGAFIDSLWETLVRTVERLVSLADLMRLRAFWWLFDVIGIICFGYAAISLLSFLQHVNQQWAVSQPQVFGIYVAYLPWSEYLQYYPQALVALVSGAVALICAVITATLRAAPKSQTFFRFLRDANLLGTYLGFGGFIAVGFCMFAGVLWTSNELALIGVQMLTYADVEPFSDPKKVGLYHAAPFVQPDPLAILSLILLIVAFIWRTRERRRNAGADTVPS